jgi:putative SOS response-associated peptidase YedK
MCGRVGFFDDIAWSRAVNNYYGRIDNRIGKLTPRYNIAPSQPLATLLSIGTYTFTHFGLIPHWMKERKMGAINARAEIFSHLKIGSHKILCWIHPGSPPSPVLGTKWKDGYL